MKQIVVQCEDRAIQFALIEQDRLVEYYVDKHIEQQGVGNIYNGRIVNVLPGMEAAFVDIGQGKNAFLYIDDVLPAHLERQAEMKRPINELVREGQNIMVQVMKEPLGSKGARVTTHYSLPGRLIVYMPNADYVGVSRKISSEDERQRLKALGESMRNEGEGLILRTVAEGESEQTLLHDLNMMRDIWQEVLQHQGEQPPRLIYHDLKMLLRLVRDVFDEDIKQLTINDAEQGHEIIQFMQAVSPHLTKRVKIVETHTNLDEQFRISEQLDKAFRRKVWLDNGGYLIIDHTEALTVIDVNTGKFIGSVDLEQTAFETNKQAAEKIACLLRLRDIGGMIVVDFIDMIQEEHREQVVETLEKLMKNDRTKTLVVGWTKLGLLEITRKKIRENMEASLYEVCPHCNGSGRI